MVAGEPDDRAHRHARLAHVDQDEADALLRPHLGVGPREAEHVVGELSVRRPDLAAVDDVTVAVSNRGRLEAREVRSRSRLRKALAPIIVA
jgi:hypothetical protein